MLHTRIRVSSSGAHHDSPEARVTVLQQREGLSDVNSRYLDEIQGVPNMRRRGGKRGEGGGERGGGREEGRGAEGGRRGGRRGEGGGEREGKE